MSIDNEFNNSKKERFISQSPVNILEKEILELKDLVTKLTQDTDRIKAENENSFKNLKDLVGGMANNQGSVSEEFFFNTLKHNPVLGNIKFNNVIHQLSAGKKGSKQEYDILLINDKIVAIVEVKYKAHINDLKQVEKQIERIRIDCKEYKNHTIYGGIAALSVPSDVIQAAIEKGLFVLQQKGEILEAQIDGIKAF